MRLLVLSCMLPLPLNNGARMRLWSLLRGLAAEGHDVRLLCLSRPDDLETDYEAIREVCSTIDVVPLAFADSFKAGHSDRLRSLFSAAPHMVGRFASPEMRSLTASRAADADAVFCYTCYSAVNVPPFLTIPLILDNANVEHMIIRRYIEKETNPFKRAYAWTEYVKLRRWEQKWNARASVALACSEDDAVALHRLNLPEKPSVVPNTIDVQTYTPTAEVEPNTIVYTGTMDWFPNRDAVEYFATEILPRVRAMVPGARFVVAGRTAPPDFLRRFENMPGVHFTGTVPDMRIEIGKAAVCVVPLRIGSGTRLKILEAAAMAKPIVSTTIGAEGLAFHNGSEIVLADDPGEFASAIGRFLTDPAVCAQFGAAARGRVVRSYSFESLRNSLAEVLEPIAARVTAS